MPTSEDPNCFINWTNSTDRTVVIQCEGFETLTLEPSSATQDLPFRTTNNASLQMQFSTEDDPPIASRIQWRTVADMYALTQRDGDAADRAVKLVPQDVATYCLSILRTQDDAGILIVGTIDIK